MIRNLQQVQLVGVLKVKVHLLKGTLKVVALNLTNT